MKSKAEGEQILMEMSKVSSHHETLLPDVCDAFHFV